MASLSCFSVWTIVISEGFYGTQKASPFFFIHGHPCAIVLCTDVTSMACPHVSAHVTGRLHMRPKRRKEEKEILLPCPLIVFSVLSGSSPTLWEYPYIPGNRGGEGQPASVTCPHLICSWSSPSLLWCEHLLLSNLIIHPLTTCLFCFLSLSF